MIHRCIEHRYKSFDVTLSSVEQLIFKQQPSLEFSLKANHIIKVYLPTSESRLNSEVKLNKTPRSI